MAEFDDLIPSDTVVTDDPFADLIPQPVIRLAPPGSLRPDDLVPAIRKIGGEIVLGQRDETHPDIIDRTGLKATEIDQRGFAGPKGEFYDRESAAQGTQLPTWFEPGRLHSTDLIQGQEQASALTPVFGPVLKPGVTQDLSMFQRPEGFQEQLQAAEKAEADLPRIEFPKAPPVDKDLTLREEVWTLPARVIGGEEAAKVQAQVGRSLYNAAVSVPEFFTTDEGLLSLLTGATAAGRPLVTGYFGYQMAQSVLDQTKKLHKDWDTMSPVQKADALTQLAAAGVLSLGLAKHTFTATEAARAAGFGLKPAPPIPEKGPEYAVKTREEQKGGVGEHPQAAEGRLSVEAGDRDRPGEPAPLPEERPAKSQVLLKPHIAAAKLTPEGDVIYARDHRAAEIEMASGQDGFLVLPEGSDSMLLEYDSLTLSPKHMQELNAEFVSLQEAQAAKGDIVAAARLKSEARKRQERPAQGEVLLTPESAAAAAELAKPKAAAPEPAAAKEPWQMTQGEFLESEALGMKRLRQSKLQEVISEIENKIETGPRAVGVSKVLWLLTRGKRTPLQKRLTTQYDIAKRNAELDPRVDDPIKAQVHKRLVQSAIEQGKSVPTNVLKDYPDLAKKAQPTLLSLPEGPGAASVTDFPKEAQIEQLAREVGRVKGEKAPLLDRVKEAFSLGRQRQAAGDLVTRTLSGLKTAGDYLINTWRGPTKLDDILRVKGELSAELETRSWRLRQAMRDLKQAVPQRTIREAIAKYVDAGGDEAKLRAALDTVPANRKSAYQRALNLTPDEKLVAGHIQSYFEARLQEAIDAGVLEEGIDDYIHRIYPKDTPWRRGIVNAIQNGLLDTRKPGLARQRVFELDADAERAGYQPISDFLPRLIEYEASLSKAIASRAAVKRFSEVKMADGRPMVDVAGMGTPIEDPATGVREATLIKPKFKPGQDQFDAEGNPNLNYRKDYVARDYPALRKWRWATADADGNPIFVQGDVLIHPDAVKRMDVLLQPSKLREYGAIRAALAIGSAFKQTMLDLSGFHQVQITVHGGEHKVIPLRLVQDIDFTNPEIQRLLRGGLTLGGDARSGMYQEGLVGRSLTRLVPGLGDLLQSYHEWLFQSYIPRMKTTMALHALERNKARFAKDLTSGRITPDVLYHQTAKEANAAFGELNYIMLERSKTAQDLSRLILLAPDFLEARARFALQAGTRLGGEQRMALLLGALTMYITARLANKVISGEYHTEPENLFSIVYNGKAYSLRTVQGDILHALEEPLRFWLHRLNPTLTRPLLQLITQRDEFGRKRTFWQIMGDSISNIVPISLRRSREQQWHTALLNAFGGSVRRDSDVRRVYDAASAWKKQQGIRGEPGEFIYDPASDVYRPLKLAILDGNTEAAATEYRKLIDSKTLTARQAEQHFVRYARSPFTGSQKNEKKFFRSLSKEMQLQYEGAKQEKLRVLKGFRQARSLAASLKPTSAFDDLIPAGK